MNQMNIQTEAQQKEKAETQRVEQMQNGDAKQL
jgi:hypothetical protein